MSEEQHMGDLESLLTLDERRAVKLLKGRFGVVELVHVLGLADAMDKVKAELMGEGKLRAVEEVELILGISGVTYIKTCPVCQTRQPGKYPFCPGCGNKIKQ
jgi:hypothetical protein